MSRIGKKPVPIVGGVKVAVQGQHVRIDGPKGKLDIDVHPAISVSVDEPKKEIVVTRKDDLKQTRALHGLTRSLLSNMIVGASQGYTKLLEIQGVGYKAELKGKSLAVNVGYANIINMPIPACLNVTVEGQRIIVTGADKQAVGQFAAEVRKIRKPEPYKGKGIRYVGEYVKIKPGKAVTGTAAK